jgi:hypothetical protein
VGFAYGLKLTVNETKTKLGRVPAETFDFPSPLEPHMLDVVCFLSKGETPK